MKTKVFLMSLALTCLWGCQQEDAAEPTNDQTINFTGVVIGDGALSRAIGTSIDVISMRTEMEDAFTVFNLKEDTRSWNEFGKTDEVVFYAHYPRLPEEVASKDTRVLKGGTDDYLFGQAKAVAGQQQVCLQFKRVMAPLEIEVLDENGKPYQGAVEIGALLKNKGLQNLKDGSITTLDEKEYAKFECSNTAQPVVNLLPQKLEKGTLFQVQLGNGKMYSAAVEETVELKPGEAYKATFKGDKLIVSIFDPVIPL
ncbi:fimbrillin family protein [Bacteroides sp.]